MKPAEAAREILALTDELARRGGTEASNALKVFLGELAVSAGLKAVKKTKISVDPNSAQAPTRVGARPKRPPEADMSKTIDELAKKLRDAFNSDDRFESVLRDPQTQTLSKSNVVALYNRVFDEPRPLSRSITKPEVFNAIRRERINRVRSGY